ncbi:MAG: hypothetical protein K2H97_09680 [Prevotella sp.]|nr:hypothetical protein [Prevotella sp.]
MMLREKLVSDFAGIILGAVRNNGWLTEISDGVGINRRNFNRRKLAKMPLHCVLRILTGLAWKMSWCKFCVAWMALGKLIYEVGDRQFFEFSDERKKLRKTDKSNDPKLQEK